jgi:hypothetical protein
MKTLTKFVLAFILLSTYAFAGEMRGVGPNGVSCSKTKDAGRSAPGDKTPQVLASLEEIKKPKTDSKQTAK